MSARDELAAVIDAADDAWDKVVAPSVEWAQDMADAILAAGYTKPRTVMTFEELDALPAGSVIRDPLNCIKRGDGSWGTFSGDTYPTSRIDLPAAVLYEPAP